MKKRIKLFFIQELLSIVYWNKSGITDKKRKVLVIQEKTIEKSAQESIRLFSL